MLNKVTIIALFLLLVSSCLFDSWSKRIDENFKVGYVNMTNQRNIYCLNQGVFRNEYVTAINWNGSFIVVRTAKRDSSKLKRYFIINKKKYLEDHYNNSINNAGVEGPLPKPQFETKIRAIGFTGDYKYTWD